MDINYVLAIIAYILYRHTMKLEKWHKYTIYIPQIYHIYIYHKYTTNIPQIYHKYTIYIHYVGVYKHGQCDSSQNYISKQNNMNPK